MRHCIYLISCIILILLLGCSTINNYFNNRVSDARDCTGLIIGGLSLPFDIGADITYFFPIGLGVTGNPDTIDTEGYGFVGRQTGEIIFSSFYLPLPLTLIGKLFDFDEDIGGIHYCNYKKKGWNKKRYGRIGAHFGLLYFISFDIEIIEIADFVSGIFGLDLCQDDENISLKENKDNDINRFSLTRNLVDKLDKALSKYLELEGEIPGRLLIERRYISNATLIGVVVSGLADKKMLKFAKGDVWITDGQSNLLKEANESEIKKPELPKVILDGWGNPIVMRFNLYEHYKTSDMKKPGFIDIYSKGPNGKDDTRGVNTTKQLKDDIGNWDSEQ